MCCWVRRAGLLQLPLCCCCCCVVSWSSPGRRRSLRYPRHRQGHAVTLCTTVAGSANALHVKLKNWAKMWSSMHIRLTARSEDGGAISAVLFICSTEAIKLWRSTWLEKQPMHASKIKRMFSRYNFPSLINHDNFMKYFYIVTHHHTTSFVVCPKKRTIEVFHSSLQIHK